MKTTLAFLFLVLSPAAFAEKISSTIHSIDLGKAGEPHLIRFDNGRASFLTSEKNTLLMVLEKGIADGDELEVKINGSNMIYSAKVSSQRKSFQDDETDTEESDDEPRVESIPFRPTVLRTQSEAKRIFRKMRKDYSRAGECYNRAHVWTYEANKRSGQNLMKIFMFFTERYIRRYRYHWWFHVTPMVYVGDKFSPRTLDRRYTSGPRRVKAWSDTFIKSKRSCKVVKKFDDFWLNQEREDCYHIHASMYYVIPRDLEKRDLTGVEKSEFVTKEIKRAYRNGFKKYPRYL